MSELKPGDFFTVNEWISHRDNSYKGACLEAIVVDGDFVRATHHIDSARKRKLTLDLRQIRIQRLSAAFVEDVLFTEGG